MKKRNTKFLTLMLAGTLCAATLTGGAISLANTAYAAEAKKYALSEIVSEKGVFSASGATIDVDNSTTAFSFAASTDSVSYHHDLALSWYEAKDVKKGLNFEFSFKEANFQDVSFTLEAKSAQATLDDISANTVKLTAKGSNVYSVSVLNGKVENKTQDVTIAPNTKLKVELQATERYGKYDVMLAVGTDAAINIGMFTNIGSNFADGDTKLLTPLEVKATPNASATTVVYFHSLNGQSFAADADKKVTDNASPVVVVDNGVGGFLVGTQFDLDYEVIDVLDTSLTKTAKYYQWNPTDTEVKYDNTVTTKTKFAETPCYIDGNGVYKKKEAYDALTDKTGWEVSTLFRKEGRELVSIQFEVADDSHDTTKIPLDWYVTDPDALFVEGGETYIVVDRNTKGAEYNGIEYDGSKYVYTKVDGTKTENYDESELKGWVESYQELLEKDALEIYAGSDAELAIPEIDWLIADPNSSYQQLKFIISYKKPTSSTPTATSPLAYNKLEIPTAAEGVYEFKIYATDETGNKMKGYVDGEEVELTSTNVWDIEAIPSFTFEVANQGLKTADNEDSDTLDTQVKDEKYTMSDVKIVGASNKKSNYKLYKLDLSQYKGGSLTASAISKVKFAALKKVVDAKLPITGDDYFAVYKNAFAQALAEHLGATGDDAVAQLEKMFDEIDAYTEGAPEDGDNRFNWDPATRSFTAADSGVYIIIADYYDNELPAIDRVMAYQLIEVASEADVIKGETEWLKNNLVSVILFAVAALMLVLIIILLLIKPSDETLEDVEAKAAKKAEKKKKDK